MKARAAVVGLVTALGGLASVSAPSLAAAGTTCLCRSDDGRTFKQKTFRHHRWACDVKLGYTTHDESEPTRPATQTCNDEEIIQYKVWACMEHRCTYQYAKRIETKNPGLEVIEPMQGPRKP
jgi:hypothetical protein